MIERENPTFTLGRQAAFYGTMSLVSFATAMAGIMYFKDLTVFSSGVMMFAFTWPLTIAAGAAYLLKKSLSLEKQLGMEQGEMDEIEDVMDEMTEMFQPVEDEEEESQNE